jgi:hypothetical protein
MTMTVLVRVPARMSIGNERRTVAAIVVVIANVNVDAGAFAKETFSY